MNQSASTSSINPLTMIMPQRKITGMSAILLPFLADGEIDWGSFEQHTAATLDAGLTPAINMDTGYANLITADVRQEALNRATAVAAGRSFLGGVFVSDNAGAAFQPDAYRSGIAEVQASGGTPILFQSYGLTSGDDDQILAAYQTLAQECDSFYAFELGNMFAPFGKIYSLELYERLLGVSNCAGAKHSSLNRVQEWQRIELRNRVRPDFLVLTGNDLAIDMVMYGSDYLLGLSTFHPAAFAQRDQWWADGDARFFQLNDQLQYLGMFAFRAPVPAYKHSAAMFLRMRGKLETDQTHPDSPGRPDSDRVVLQQIAADIDAMLADA
tara:strand:+ start:790 stop:1767 length:978 start_codon:yes stop_codon:yes gene_type:complete